MDMVFRVNASSACGYRISPGDSNYFVLLFDKERGGIDTIMVVEIFAFGGRTPPNIHRRAHEFFYVLSGEAAAVCGGKRIRLGKGDAFLVPPGTEHVVENIGSGKLYTLTVMCPNEGFAELIRAGQPVALDDEDRLTLGGS